jgi:ACS family tartrate transporter-like MFS transporter
VTSTISAPASAELLTTTDDSDLARSTLRKASARLLPFLFILFICNYLDRTNIAIAALQMNHDLGFSASAYGLGSGIFFVGYALFEVPSNVLLARVGARRWISRIMVTWGLIAAAMMFVRTPMQFYALRVLLGIAEAGFFPGIVYYLSNWFPAAQRGRTLSWFMTAVPLSGAIGNPLSASLLALGGRGGLAGWQWLFLLEGIPSVVLGLVVLVYLSDRPSDARWLSLKQREWLAARLRLDDDTSRAPHGLSAFRALAQPAVLLASAIYFLAMTAGYGYLFWAPTLIRGALHASNAATGFVTGIIACVAALVMMVVATHSDRTRERYLHASACLAIAALGYFGTAVLPGAVARVVGLALVPIGVYGFLGPFWCLPSALLRGTAAAAGIALVNSIGNVGGVVGPYTIGLATDLTGSATGAYLMLAALALGGAALCLVLRSRDAGRGPHYASRY